MRIERLLAGAAAAALMAGAAFAQTSGSNGASAMQPAAGSSRPYAPPPTTGGAMQPSAGDAAGSMATTGAPAAGATAAYTPLQPVPGANIIATLKASGEFTKLLAGLAATNLTNLVATHPNLTLFAPTDAAFAQLPPGQLDQLMKSPAQLQEILAYHLIAATLTENDIKGHAAGKEPTAANKPVTIDGSGPSIKVNDATVLQPGVMASNGIIYPIDKVLTPTP